MDTTTPTSLQMPITKPGCHLSSSLGLINLLEWITELRENSHAYWLIKGYEKDTDEQPDEEAHRVESRRMKSQEQVLLSPWSWGVSPSWYVNVLTHPGAL